MLENFSETKKAPLTRSLAGSVEISLCDSVHRRRGGGRVTAMAKLIEYYIPDRFKKPAKWIPATQRGKVIEFPTPEKKSA